MAALWFFPFIACTSLPSEQNVFQLQLNKLIRDSKHSFTTEQGRVNQGRVNQGRVNQGRVNFVESEKQNLTILLHQSCRMKLILEVG